MGYFLKNNQRIKNITLRYIFIKKKTEGILFLFEGLKVYCCVASKNFKACCIKNNNEIVYLYIK